jgi:hypothetical protein
LGGGRCPNVTLVPEVVMKSIALWLLGVPISVIILLKFPGAY